MLKKFGTSTKGKIGSVFLVFNILMALANIGLGVYMLIIYCDSQVITTACFSLFFGILCLYQLSSEAAWTSTPLYISILMAIIVASGTIAGVTVVQSMRGCYYLTCVKGQPNSTDINRSYCSSITAEDEKASNDRMFDNDSVKGGSILVAIPVAFGAIQITAAFIWAFISFLSIYSCACPPKKEDRGLKLFD